VTDNIGGRSAWEDDDVGPFEQDDQGADDFGPTEGSRSQATGTYGQGTGTYGQGTGAFGDSTGTFGDPTSPFPQGGGSYGRRKPSRNAIIAIAVGVVVLIGGGVGAAVALSSHTTTNNNPITTNNPTTTLSTPTGGNSPASTSPANTNTGTTSPSGPSPTSSANSGLLANAPFSNCTDLTPAQRGIPDATDEVICTGSDVATDGAVQAFYATLPSSTAAEEYLATLAHQGSPSGQCSEVQLGLGTAFCDFTDSTPESGAAVMFIGQNFSFGPNATTQANCAAENQPSTDGTAVLLFNYSGSDVVGGAFGCQASVTPLATIRSSLNNADFELDNQ
jgi:hypothetical protein